MQKYLERKAYSRLKAWKESRRHSSLEISGARQVGKTYLVNRFADEQYQQKIYINLLELSGELFLEKYHELRRQISEGFSCENPVYELIRRYAPDYKDTKDTIVIIDEIQESAEIYNRIREFTRNLESDFIVTGSYLGRILDKEFKYSAGDLDYLEIHTLDFEEFLTALDRRGQYEDMDLYGGSDTAVYQELQKLYADYCKIGGYPSVVLQYLENASIEDCQAQLLKIIRLFTNESKRYFEDILDDAVYDNMFAGIARILAKEKKGFDEAVNWLYSAGIIGFAGKLPECSIMDFKAKARCYFLDIGLASYFLTKIGCPEETVVGIINENFVYLDLKRRIVHPCEIALETPAFATLGAGEIDFYVKATKSHKTYALEVKTGKNAGRTAGAAVENGKADYLLYAKGNTSGGKVGNIITIPIYGISKFQF